jgi:capsular exopolysaccharide synthesis family protein
MAFLLEYLDYTVKTPEDLESIYGLPVQGVISVTPTQYFKKQKLLLISLLNSRTPTAESFRALRTGIQLASLKTPVHSILVTSAAPGEGKTFIAANLAASLAQIGHRVILVDTDLRRPRLHEVFKLSREFGFTNLIVNQEHKLTDAIQETSIKKLGVITCGIVPPNPAELLSSIRSTDLIKKLADQADIVIYDSPPAATVTDATILAQHVDAAIQVVWAGHTRVEHVLRCKAVLEHTGVRILGTVLNQVKSSDLGYSAYYYYSSYSLNDAKSANGYRSFWRKWVPGRKRKHYPQSVNTVGSTNADNGTADAVDEHINGKP